MRKYELDIKIKRINTFLPENRKVVVERRNGYYAIDLYTNGRVSRTVIAGLKSRDAVHRHLCVMEESFLCILEGNRKIQPYPETHAQGRISFEQNIEMGAKQGDIGIQISVDGRIWVCVDGVALLRFTPERG